MSTKDLIKGMEILLPYYDDPDGSHNSADHDIIYMHETDKPVTVDDWKKLHELGWSQEAEDENGNPVYDEDENWYMFV